MKGSSTLRWLLSLVLLLVVLSGCASQAVATPTTAPVAVATSTTAQAAAPTAAAATKTALKVADKTFTLDQIKAMKQTKITANGKDYTGVAVLDLLQAAGVTAPAGIALVGSDSFTANVDPKVLTAQDILAIDDSGKLNAVLPSTAKGAWVKDTVEIKMQAGTAAPASTRAAAATPAAAAGAPTAAPGAGAITLTDAANHQVTLAQPPQRIVVIGRGPYMALHIIYMFPEAKTRLVGMEQRGSSVSDFLPFVDPDLKSKTILAAQPGPEAVAALKPDLVIMKGIAPDTYAAAFDKLGIPYMYVWFETPDYFYKDITNIGAVFGDAKRAQEINDFYKTHIDTITKVTSTIAAGDKVRVLTIEYTDRGGKYDVSVPAKGWMQTIETQLAGGNPVWLDAAGQTDGWTVVTLEQVLAWNPDVILVIPFSSSMANLDSKKIIDGLKADPQWQALKAVKNGQLYAYGKDLYGWDNPEPRWILGLDWVATKLYPDKFKDLNLSQEIYTYFSQMYGLDKATVDKDIVPALVTDLH